MNMIQEKISLVLSEGCESQVLLALIFLGYMPSEENEEILVELFAKASDSQSSNINIAAEVIGALGRHQTVSSCERLIEILRRGDAFIYEKYVLGAICANITDDSADMIYSFMKSISHSNLSQMDHAYISLLISIAERNPSCITNQDCLDLLLVYQRYVITVVGPLMVSRSMYSAIPILLSRSIPTTQSDLCMIKQEYLTTAFTLMDGWIKEHPKSVGLNKEFALITMALLDLDGCNSPMMVKIIVDNTLYSLQKSLIKYMELTVDPLALFRLKEHRPMLWHHGDVSIVQIDKEAVVGCTNHKTYDTYENKPMTRSELRNTIDTRPHEDCRSFFDSLAQFKDPQDIPFFLTYLYADERHGCVDSAALSLMSIAPGQFSKEILTLYFDGYFSYPHHIARELLETEMKEDV